MSYIELGALYLVLCMMLGFSGRNRKWGGWAYFFSSVLLTPVIGLLLVLASDSHKSK